MLRWLLAPLIAFYTFIAGTGSSEWQIQARMVDRVSQSVVRLSGGVGVNPEEAPHGYTCTGTIIVKNRVLTAAHCLMVGLHVDEGMVRDVVRIDRFFDLALLEVRSVKPPLKLRDAPIQRYEPLTAIGYAYGWYKLSALHEIPFLLDYTPDLGPELVVAPGIFVQGGYIGGMSGGPVVDRNGLMVSIIQRAGEHSGYGVTADTIRTFLQGVL